MNNRNFEQWIATFKPSIATYDYYSDFPKIIRNIEEWKIELNILNALVGSKNMEEDFEKNHNQISGNIEVHSASAGSKRK